LRCRRDRVAEVHVEAELHGRGSDAGVHRDPNTGIQRVVTNRASGHRFGQKFDAVVVRQAGDLDNPGDDGCLVVGHVTCERVGIRGCSARVEGREQHPALEHQPVSVCRDR